MKTLFALALLLPALAFGQSKAPATGVGVDVTVEDITASGDVTADGITLTGGAAQVACSLTTATCQFNSATVDGTTSGTVGAFTFKASANITATDLLVDFQDSAGAHAMTCTEAGQCTALAGFGVPANGVLGLAAGNTHGFLYDGTNLHFRLSNASYGRINNSSGRLTWDYQILLAGATPQLATSLATSTFGITSATNDATTSSTVGAFTLQATADITATDLILDVQDSAGAHALTVTEAGTVNAPALISTASAAATSIGLPAATYLSFNGASQSGVSLYAGSTANLQFFVSGSGELYLDGTHLKPYAASGLALGTTAAPWADLALDASGRGTCTLDGASPSKCTATVTAGAICTASPVGTGVPAAVGVNLSSTTLTIYSANGLTNDVNYHCIL